MPAHVADIGNPAHIEHFNRSPELCAFHSVGANAPGKDHTDNVAGMDDDQNTQQLASEAVTLYRHEAWVLQSLLDERPGSPTILTQLDTDSNPTTTEPDIVPEPSPGQALLTLSAETVTNMTCNELRDILGGLGGCKSGNHADLVYRVCRIKSTMALLMQGTHAVSDCGVLTQVDDSAGMGAHEPDASAGAKRARRIA